MAEAQLKDLIRALEQAGVDVRTLHSLHIELETIEKPTLFGRIKGTLDSAVRRHWSHLTGEIAESREMLVLLQNRIKNKSQLTPSESAIIRTQIADLLRVVPASAIAATNSILPIPGTSLLTPWLLKRMGLLPSRWREAYILHGLEKQRKQLVSQGMAGEAKRLETIEALILSEADRRDALTMESELLPWWDDNHNGLWDPSEKKAYNTEVKKIAQYAGHEGTTRKWFFIYDKQVFGPLQLPDMTTYEHKEALLVCFDGRTQWVKYVDLLMAIEKT